ncbi:MAG: hypothetical protein A3G81_34190 [Betaproteobacteria bacterium RIFCSPLOWO2_12_FULL_65_14]|nr:MAG: hypothetical protein A3G81_34190 [Betaproteobacteria bacterium RIFCSPLOWO2_12_FULL_65_14]
MELSRQRNAVRNPVVDVHAHVFLPGVLGACGSAGPDLTLEGGQQVFRAGSYTIRGVRFRDSPMSELSLRLELMDGMGITQQILSPYPMLYFYDQPAEQAAHFCAAHNDELARLVARCPERLIGLATLPMQSPVAAIAELERAINKLGLRGASIGGRFAGRELSDPAYDPLWSLLAERALPVFLHPGPLDRAQGGLPDGWEMELIVGFAIDETLAVAHLVLGGVLDRHPGLVAVVPHGGGFAPYVRSRFEMAVAKRPWGRGLLKRPLRDIWQQLVFDCLVHDDDALCYLVRTHGADRLVVGTNFAAWDQDDQIIEQVRRLPFDDTAKSAILGGNARRLFAI